jgi:dTMP kinase
MAQIIVFSGLDGAGKSTQIGKLTDFYAGRSQKTYEFWSRGGYTPGFQLIKDCLKKLFKNRLPESGKSKERDSSFDNAAIRKAWLIFAIIDLIFYYSVYLRIKLWCGYNIICDRFILDTKIDFAIAYPNDKFENWLLWKILLLCSIKPNTHFLLLISVEESMKRSLLKFEPFPDSSEALEQRLSYYETYANGTSEIHTIWCTKSADEVFNIISKTVS